MIIAIDFDGVLHDFRHPVEGRRMGMPIEGAKEAVLELKKRHKLIVFTVWGGTPQGRKTIADWLVFYGFPRLEITNVKPNAAIFIDDRAIHFTDWTSALNECDTLLKTITPMHGENK